MNDLENPLSRRALPLGKQIRIVLVAALATAVAVAAAWSIVGVRAKDIEPDSSAGAAAAGVLKLTAAQLATLQISPVATRSFRSEEVTEGQIAVNGDSATQVFSPYSGQVVNVRVSPGEAVKKGRPLLSMAAVEFLQAQLDLLNGAAALKLASSVEQRRHAAYEAQGGSLQDWQQSQADLVTAQTGYAAARNRLRILGRSDDQIGAIERADKPDPVTYVTAPIDGVVVDRQVGPGQYIQAGSSIPVFTIADLSSVWLLAQVREVDAARVQRGQVVEVRVLAYPDQVFTATLTSVGAEVDPVTHRISVRATIANPDGRLKPQMFASCSIITSGESTSPAVPAEAVVREGDQARVWVVAQNNTLAARAIRTGRVSDGMVEVLEGLKPGERVVTRGGLFMDSEARPS